MPIFNQEFKQLKGFNIYGDLAGRYKEFLKLQNKLGGKAFSVGDICDRGPNTKELFDYLMINGNKAVLGNHDHMMLDFFTFRSFYSKDIWLTNTAGITLRSFIPEEKHQEFNRLNFEFNDINGDLASGNYLLSERDKLIKRKNDLSDIILEFVKPHVDKSYIEFLSSLPLYYKDDNVIITHAPIDPTIPFNLLTSQDKVNLQRGWKQSLMMNRGRIVKQDKIQIFGHLYKERPMVYYDSDKSPYGLCLDGSKGKKLWCYSVDRDELFYEEYQND